VATLAMVVVALYGEGAAHASTEDGGPWGADVLHGFALGQSTLHMKTCEYESHNTYAATKRKQNKTNEQLYK